MSEEEAPKRYVYEVYLEPRGFCVISKERNFNACYGRDGYDFAMAVARTLNRSYEDVERHNQDD